METATKDFLDTVQTQPAEERTRSLRDLAGFYESARDVTRKKVDLAMKMHDMVDVHIRRLDEDLARFEEEQMTGPKVMPLDKPKPEKPPATTRSRRTVATSSSSACNSVPRAYAGN
jgi:hypothetical protein